MTYQCHKTHKSALTTVHYGYFGAVPADLHEFIVGVFKMFMSIVCFVFCFVLYCVFLLLPA